MCVRVVNSILVIYIIFINVFFMLDCLVVVRAGLGWGGKLVYARGGLVV